MEPRTADIKYKDRRAGELQEIVGGGTRFVYDAGWREQIACCFSVERREHDWRQGLHPFFENLGTEGWLREQQARVAHIAEEDDLGLLLRYGADCIGAVSVHRVGAADVPIAAVEETANPGRSVSGVQRKLLVVETDRKGVFAPAGATGAAPFIAKFNSESIATVVRNEHLSLKWCEAVLGKPEVTRFALGRVDVVNEPALIVTRFDRTADGRKLRLEDCAQILCKPRGADYKGKYDASYEDVAEIIRTWSARPLIDLGRFFRRLVAFAILGNCDAHLKNFSLLETNGGLRLSPVYDAVNTVLYDGFDQTLALKIDGATRQLDVVNRKLLSDFALSIGLPQRAVEQVFDDLRRRIERAKKLLTPPAGEPPDGFVHRFSEIVSNACLRILQ